MENSGHILRSKHDELLKRFCETPTSNRYFSEQIGRWMFDLDKSDIAFLLRVAHRIVGSIEAAEDVVQSTLLEVLGGREKWESISNWNGFLCSMVVKRSIDWLRSRRAAEPLSEEPIDRDSELPIATAIHREQLELLRVALGKLPHRESEVFSLRYFADLGNAEIAVLLDISPNAVAVMMKKARNRLAQLLSKEIL